jgi:hypothetical protein
MDFYYHVKPTEFEDSVRSNLVSRLRASVKLRWNDRKGLCKPQTGRGAKRDDYSICSPEPELFFFLFFIHLYHLRRIRGFDARIYSPSIPVYIHIFHRLGGDGL